MALLLLAEQLSRRRICWRSTETDTSRGPRLKRRLGSGSSLDNLVAQYSPEQRRGRRRRPSAAWRAGHSMPSQRPRRRRHGCRAVRRSRLRPRRELNLASALPGRLRDAGLRIAGAADRTTAIVPRNASTDEITLPLGRCGYVFYVLLGSKSPSSARVLIVVAVSGLCLHI